MGPLGALCFSGIGTVVAEVQVMSEGTKHDSGKAPIDLVPTPFILAVADVLRFGALKYDAHNWRKGIRWSRVYAAIQRHLLAWNDGEDQDSESELPHLAHAACGLAFLITYAISHPDLDDRYHHE